jgi:prepilin-type N-terminal cleavage/methylation domain-containing protein
MDTNKLQGVTLIELTIVIAIIACLALISIPSLTKILAKAKRTEAYVMLHSLALAQKAYFIEHCQYSKVLSGPGGLGWKPEGTYNYTYGFSDGATGQSNFIGQLKTPASALTGSSVTPQGFTICAAADIDGDGEVDVLSINQDNVIRIVNDDLN